MSKRKFKLVFLGGKTPSSKIVWNHIARKDFSCFAFIESRVSSIVLIRGRFKRCGVLSTLSQLIFMKTVRVILEKAGAHRISSICRENKLDLSEHCGDHVTFIDSVNSIDLVNSINIIKPDLVVVTGTRIIKEFVIKQIDCPVVNIHAGITPKYRGVHGGYWALRSGDVDNCGVTLHFVDKGVDTGDVIAQERISPTPEDNFSTLPYLQVSAALPLLDTYIARLAADERISVKSSSDPGRQWFHPGVFQYLYSYFLGVK